MGSIMKVAAGAAAALGGLAIGKALFVDPIKSAGEFQQSLNVLQATSHATDARMKEISATAMKLGADTKLPAVSASDAAKAMLELAKGGFSAKESMEGARGVLLLSTAAQIDGATAATMVADALHAFGMKAKDAGVVVDDFAGAANASTATMGEVGQALQQSGQAFHGLGIPVGDAATAIAAMANAGIKGSDAGTSLKTMLMRLNPETKKAKKAFEDMGVSAYDSNGKFVGMREVITQLGPKLAGMTQKQKQHTLATIFGSDASRAAAIVLGMTGAQWDKLHGSVTRAGQAQALADAQTKGFKGAMAGLRSTIETIQLQIGLKLLPVLTTFVRFLSANLPAAVAAVGKAFGVFGDAIRSVADWLGVFQDKATSGNVRIEGLANKVDNARTRFDAFVDALRTAVDVAQQVAAVVGPILAAAFSTLLGVIKGVIGVISSLVSWLNQNRDVLVAAGAAVAVIVAAMITYEVVTRTVRAAIMIATAAQAAFNAVMLMNPVGLTVLAIAALVAALVLLYTRSETARTIMNAAFNTIRATAEAVFGWMTNTLIPGAIAAWNRFGPGVVAALQGAVSAIKTIVEAIATVVRTVVDQIRAHWEAVWKIFGPIVTAQMAIVRTIVTTVLNVISGVVKLFAALLRGDWSAAWNALKGIVSDVLNGVVSVVTSLLSGLVGTAKALAVTVGQGIGNGIKDGVRALAGLAGELAGKVGDAISQAAGSAFAYARQIGFRIADGALSGLGNLASRLGQKIADAASSAVSWAGSKLPGSGPFMFTIHTVGKPMAEGVIQGFEKASDAARPRLAAAVRKMGDELRAATTKELPKIQADYKKWAEGAKAAFDAQIGNMTKTIEANFSKAQAKLDAWKAKLTPAEFQVAANAAAAAVARVQADVSASAAALATLPAKQAAAWSALLAQQQANMAALKATLQSTTDDALLAGNTFNKSMAAAASDPLAANLIAAQKQFDNTKILFDQGLVSQATFIEAANILDDAKVAAAQDSNATTLLDQYNTWQTALKQQADAGAAITTQQAADLEAQHAQQETAAGETAAAVSAHDAALLAEKDFYLQKQAEKERNAKDAQYEKLSGGLKAMHDRVLTHLGNVQHAWDIHYDALNRMAAQGGNNIGDNLARALRNSIPTVAAAAAAVAQVIKDHLKVRSPTKTGPMSDLDEWWTRLAPTLVASLDTAMVKSALSDAVTPGIPGGARPGAAAVPAAAARLPQRVQLDENVSRDLRELVAMLKRQQTPALPVTVIATGGADAAVYAAKR